MLRYLEIKAQLKDIISDMSPGDKLPDRVELCRRLDTTRTTLDKAIRELANQGMLSSRKGSGTYIASELDDRVTSEESWGVIVPDISEAIYATLVSGIECVSQIYNANVILCNSNGNPLTQQRFIKRLLNSGVSGFIIVPVIENSVQENSNLYNVLVRSRVPFIFCNRSVDGISAPVVTSNDFYGGNIATKYLISNGYRKIAFISEYKYRTSMDRCQGYLSALLENDIEINRRLIVMPSYSEKKADVRGQTDELLKAEKPDAVFCFNDAIAFQVIDVIHKNGLRVSDDIGVIGYDDTEACNSQTPAITSVSYKTYEIGQKAAEVLYKQIHGQKLRSGFDYYLFQPEITVRESCRGVKGEDA